MGGVCRLTKMATRDWTGDLVLSLRVPVVYLDSSVEPTMRDSQIVFISLFCPRHGRKPARIHIGYISFLISFKLPACGVEDRIAAHSNKKT